VLIINGEEKDALLEHLKTLKMFYKVHSKLTKGFNLHEDFEVAYSSLCELERRIGATDEEN
jgi:hypothetical protein